MTWSALLGDLRRLLATSRPIPASLQGLSDRMEASCADTPELAALVVRLYDPLTDERWLRELWAPTQLLLLGAAAGLGAPGDLRKRLVARVHQLRADFGPHGTPDALRPSFTRTPFAAFHWSMWQYTRRGRAQVYFAVAGVIHRQVRALEQGMLDDAPRFGTRLDRNLYRYLRSARILCLYGPRLQEMSVRLRRELIHAGA